MLNLKFLIPLLVIVASPSIAPVAQAYSSSSVIAQNKCFNVSNNRLQVKRSINAKQLEYLKVIKVSKQTYQQIIFNFSLENNIKQCLENSQPINGFKIPMIMTKPGMVSIDSLTRFVATNLYWTVVDGNSKYNIRAKGIVDALFSESKGYIITSTMKQY
jgi:hypothetical protein